MNKNRISKTIIYLISGLITLFPATFAGNVVSTLLNGKDAWLVSLVSGLSTFFFVAAGLTLIGFGIHSLSFMFIENEFFNE